MKLKFEKILDCYVLELISSFKWCRFIFYIAFLIWLVTPFLSVVVVAFFLNDVVAWTISAQNIIFFLSGINMSFMQSLLVIQSSIYYSYFQVISQPFIFALISSSSLAIFNLLFFFCVQKLGKLNQQIRLVITPPFFRKSCP